MRILALSDTHIGAGYEHRRDALADTDVVLARIVNLAVERQVGLVLHAGDVFHRAKPSPAELHCFKRFADALADYEIPMVAIGGNGLHEAPAGQKSALELFAGPLVRVSRTPEVLVFAEVAVCTLPAASLGRLAAEQGSSDRADLAEQAVDLLLASARDLFAQAPSDRPRILLGHQMVSGASLPNGMPLEALGSVLPLWALEEIGYDAIVLGDIHKPQLLAELSFIAYCGSPMRHDFGEQGTRPGVWLLDLVPDQRVDYQFIELEDRRFVTIDVDLTSLGGGEMGAQPGGELSLTFLGASLVADSPHRDETDQIAAAIAERLPLTDAVVRIRYQATEEHHRRVDHRALEKLVADAGAHRLYGGISWQPVRTTRARAAEVTETLAPLAAVSRWCQASEVPFGDAEGLGALIGNWLKAEA